MKLKQHTKRENLTRLLIPKSIVFIGNKRIVQQGIQNCKQLDYKGDIFVVNKTGDEIEGATSYKNISDLPKSIDAAFLAIRGDRTIDAVKELVKQEVAGCVCHAAGFSEIGNMQLQKDLVEAAGDMALVGPNCYGFINYLDQAPLWPDRFGGKVVEKGVAIISQSGNISLNLTMTDRSLPVAFVISVGNQAVLEIADYIDVLSKDPRVTAIGLHIEGINDVTAFSHAAEAALDRGVPLIALKTGTSEMGSQLTMSHTSSLAGSDDLYNVLFNRLNISRVDSLTSFIETLKIFSIGVQIVGYKLGVLTCSGGESTIVADLAAKYGFTLPALNAYQTSSLENQLTAFEHVSNPLDYNTSIWGKESELVRCFTTFMGGNFNVTLLVIDLLEPESGDIKPWEASVNAIIKAREENPVPVVVTSTFSEGIPAHIREKLTENGIVPLQGITEAFLAIKAVIQFNIKRNMPLFGERLKSTFLVNRIKQDSVHAITIDEWEGKKMLAAYGIQVPKGRLINKKEDLKQTDQLNYPLVVKGVSKSIAHKKDLGAVFINLQSEQEVALAIEQIDKNLMGIPTSDRAFLIEEMIQETVAELNIGLKRDPQFGLALVIGMGGELVNLLHDSVPILLPTTRAEITEALSSIKGIKLLEGFRGRKIGDIESVVDVAESIANYAEDNQDTILELDVNPLLVLPKGQGAVAVDVLIRIA